MDDDDATTLICSTAGAYGKNKLVGGVSDSGIGLAAMYYVNRLLTRLQLSGLMFSGLGLVCNSLVNM